jgi:hypothetical protein
MAVVNLEIIVHAEKLKKKICHGLAQLEIKKAQRVARVSSAVSLLRPRGATGGGNGRSIRRAALRNQMPTYLMRLKYLDSITGDLDLLVVGGNRRRWRWSREPVWFSVPLDEMTAIEMVRHGREKPCVPLWVHLAVAATPNLLEIRLLLKRRAGDIGRSAILYCNRVHSTISDPLSCSVWGRSTRYISRAQSWSVFEQALQRGLICRLRAVAGRWPRQIGPGKAWPRQINLERAWPQ